MSSEVQTTQGGGSIEPRAKQALEHEGTRPGWIFRPDVDIVERPAEYVVTADLPGAGEGDVQVHLENGVLSIDAQPSVAAEESWNPLAEKLASRGLTVLAIDFRGYGRSTPGRHPAALHEDVLGAIRYLQGRGVQRISLLGASMGGAAVSAAAAQVKEDEIDRVILLAPSPLAVAEGMRGYKALIVSRGEPLAPRLEERFQLIPDPKRLIILPGSAHAQHVFATEYGPLLMTGIVDFLLRPRDALAAETSTSR
ncbi:MAG: alpha/beta fold hydrolase [Deltaproteobacteria bacterium]|nr:MAG: alpha/beta fold hydrolase [Deltaproteobacteria bacterium]